MDKTVLLVASSTLPSALSNSYKRAFESFGFRVEIFNLDAAKAAASPQLAPVNRAVQRFMNYVDLPSITQKANRTLVMTAMALEPSLIVVMCNESVRPGTLVQLKIALPTAKLVNVYPDMLFNMTTGVVQCLPLYDLFGAHTKAGVDVLRQLGCTNPFFLPLAADPSLHHPMSLTAEEEREFGCELVYVGNWRPEHEQLFERLSEFDLAIWGADQWKRAKPGGWVRSRWRGRPLVTGPEYAKAHLAAKVCLNPIDPLNLPGHNQRVFELPACRVFSLVTRTEDMQEIFREGETVECFDSEDELVRKIRHYLAHPTERERIAAAAYTHVVDGGHTYRDRVISMLTALGRAEQLG